MITWSVEIKFEDAPASDKARDMAASILAVLAARLVTEFEMDMQDITIKTEKAE